MISCSSQISTGRDARWRLHRTGTSCGSVSGIFTRAKRSTPLVSRTATARFRLRFEMCGNGRPGIEGQRRQHRIDHLAEIRLHGAALAIGELRVIAQLDAGGFERGCNARARSIGVGHELLHCGADALELLGDAAVQHVGRGLLLQHRHADHEKLVQVREQNGEKFDALEQRIGGILRFFEHAALEGQQAQLAVQVQFWVVQRRRGLEHLRLHSWAGHCQVSVYRIQVPSSLQTR